MIFQIILLITTVIEATTHEHQCAVEMTNELCELYSAKCGSMCNDKPDNSQWANCMSACMNKDNELANLQCSQTYLTSGKSFLANMVEFIVNNGKQNKVDYDCVTKTSCSIWRYCAQHHDAKSIKSCLSVESSTRFDTCVIGTEHSTQGMTEYTCYQCKNCAFFLPPVYKDEDCFDSLGGGCCLSLDGCFTQRDASGTVNRGCITRRDQCDTCSECHDSYCNDQRSAATVHSVSFILLSLLLIHS